MNIAVLMTTYNGEKYLESQIESIIAQKINADVALIVRDDGSTDRTLDILGEYAKKGVLRYSAGENLGAAKGFITLVQENPGYDFYAFADQDDVWNEDKLQKGMDAIEQYSGPALYCSNATLVHSDLTPIGRDVHRLKPTYNLVSILCLASCAQGCTSVFNKELAEVIRSHRIPEVYIMHDSLVTCLCALIDGKIVYDHEPTMQYRMHSNNVFGMVTAKQSVWRVVRSRVAEIMQKEKISMYTQAQNLLDTYSDLISDDNKRICRVVIGAENSLVDRCNLIFARDLKHDTFNKTITKKLKILFGND